MVGEYQTRMYQLLLSIDEKLSTLLGYVESIKNVLPDGNTVVILLAIIVVILIFQQLWRAYS